MGLPRREPRSLLETGLAGEEIDEHRREIVAPSSDDQETATSEGRERGLADASGGDHGHDGIDRVAAGLEHVRTHAGDGLMPGRDRSGTTARAHCRC